MKNKNVHCEECGASLISDFQDLDVLVLQLKKDGFVGDLTLAVAEKIQSMAGGTIEADTDIRKDRGVRFCIGENHKSVHAETVVWPY